MRRRIDNVWDTHQEATAMHGGTWIGCGMIAGALFPAAMI